MAKAFGCGAGPLVVSTTCTPCVSSGCTSTDCRVLPPSAADAPGTAMTASAASNKPRSVVGMAILFTSIFSGIGLLGDRQFGFLKETLVAPVPRLQIMLGRTLGGATIASIQGTLILIVCMIAGFRPYSAAMIPLAFAFMLLVGLVFAGLGTAIGSSLKDMQGFQLIMNFLVMPIFFLSGALFPLNNLPTALAVATRVDPLSYGIDGLRGALIGLTQFGVIMNFGVLMIFASGFLVLGAWAFSRIQI
jgi:ABC-2 type transport system permease protein